MKQQSVKIAPKVLQALEALSKKRNQSLSETLRHAINTEVYMDEQLQKGSTILCQDQEGEVWKVIFTHMQ